MSMQVKKIKPIREISNILEKDMSTLWYIVKINECTDQLRKLLLRWLKYKTEDRNKP